MDGVELLPREIAAALERGALVVTGNQRAARTLRRELDHRNRELGLGSWEPAAVMTWDTWMISLWRGLVIEGHAVLTLLNQTQEHAVWRAVLEADARLASLRAVDSLAEMAAEAWRLICNYNGVRRLQGAAGNEDARSFQRWAAVFERTCRAEGFLTQAQIVNALCEAIEAGQIAIPARGVVLVGFDSMTPEQTKLVEAMRLAGGMVEEFRPTVDSARRVLVRAADEQEELIAAARWVRQFLETRPHSKIAVIVPGLETERGEIDRVFREVLAPELEDIRSANQAGPYEFSLGVALSRTPMVVTALDLLRWAAGELPLEQVSRLLLSPYLAFADKEREARAEFDAFELRNGRMLRPEISLNDLTMLVERSKRRSKLSRLLRTLREMSVLANRLRGMEARGHAEWAEAMREMLGVATHDAGSKENSVEFQTRRKWESALDELATLDFDGVPVEFVQTFEALERIARQMLFAPESSDAPVQVMGPLEAAGSLFDAAWFLRGGELSWPIETRSNGLLPWSLQRELGMPGADVVRDSEHARRMTERIAGSAATVVFSYARHVADSRQRPSAVVRGLGLEEVDATEVTGAAVEREIVAVEEIEDVARVRQLPDRVIHGGARILELQAACGFRAFAERRLWATGVESVVAGMDARESGTVVHEVLKFFWDGVRTQDALKSMTTKERNEVLDWCITEALKKTDMSSATAWDVAYLDVQRDRLRRLLSRWLDLEMQRVLPFEVKMSEKEFQDVRVGPLRLSVRMDRVDEVAGGEMLIDYKTGSASPSDWLTERPDAPQLPLYAILSDAERLQGVAFALVRAGDGRAWKGYAAKEGVLPGRLTRLKEAPTFDAQVERWREVLVRLAEQFHAGEARVDPKQYPKTCEYCEQRILCRLDVSSLEESLLEGDDEDDAAEEIHGG